MAYKRVRTVRLSVATLDWLDSLVESGDFDSPDEAAGYFLTQVRRSASDKTQTESDQTQTKSDQTHPKSDPIFQSDQTHPKSDQTHPKSDQIQPVESNYLDKWRAM